MLELLQMINFNQLKGAYAQCAELYLLHIVLILCFTF
jgi:hypothetical protein